MGKIVYCKTIVSSMLNSFNNEYQSAYTAHRRHTDIAFADKHRDLAKQWYERNKDQTCQKRVQATQTRTITNLLEQLCVKHKLDEIGVIKACLDLLNTKTQNGETSVYMLALNTSKSKTVCAVATYHIICSLYGGCANNVSLEDISKAMNISVAALSCAMDKLKNIIKAVQAGTEKDLHEYSLLQQKRLPGETVSCHKAPPPPEESALCQTSSSAAADCVYAASDTKNSMLSSLLMTLLRGKLTNEQVVTPEQPESVHKNNNLQVPKKMLRFRLDLEIGDDDDSNPVSIIDIRKNVQVNNDLLVKLCSLFQ